MPNSPELADTLADEIKDAVLTQEFRDQLAIAIMNSDAQSKSLLIHNVKRKIAELIMEKTLPEKLRTHVAREGAREIIAKAVSDQFNACLRAIPDTDTDAEFNPKLNRCITRATNQATFEVFREQLHLALEEQFPSYGVANQAQSTANRQVQAQIRQRLMTPQLHTEVARANAQGPAGLERLTRVFKARAAGEVAVIKANEELAKHFSGAALTAIRTQAAPIARACFSSLETSLKAGENSNINEEIEKCSRDTRRDIGKLVLEKRLKENLGIISNHGQHSWPAMRSGDTAFESCMSNHYSWSKSQYNQRFSQCINRSVLSFSEEVGRQTLSFLRPVRKGSERAMPAFSACLSPLASKLDEHVSWLTERIQDCKNTSLMPQLFHEISDHYASRLPSGLRANERRVAMLGMELLRPAINGKITSASSSGNSMTALQESIETLSGRLSEAVVHDTTATETGIRELQSEVAREISQRGSITQDRFTRKLVDSRLMTPVVGAALFPRISQAYSKSYWGLGAAISPLRREHINTLLTQNGGVWMTRVRNEVLIPALINGENMDTKISEFEARHRAGLSDAVSAILF